MKQLILSIAVTAAMSFGVSHAGSFTFTLTPVSVCEDDGSNCTQTTFDKSVVDTIFAQADVTIDLAPEVEIRDSSLFTATGINDYLFSVRDAVNAVIGTTTPWFAFVPSSVTNDAFTNGFTNAPGFVLRDTAGPTFEAQVIARGIGRTLGLQNCEVLYAGMCDDNLMASDPSNIGNNLLAGQISSIQQSAFLEADPVPLPAAAWVFLAGLAGLTGWRKSKAV